MNKNQYNNFLTVVARPLLAVGLVVLMASYWNEPTPIHWGMLLLAVSLIATVLFTGCMNED